VPSAFEAIVRAYGHTVVAVRELELQETSDGGLLRKLGPLGLDALLSLDNNRQPEVWAEMMLELADGRGRLVRIKTRSAEVPTVPVLTRYWATPYERIEGLLGDSTVRLIQVGLQITSQRRIAAGVRGYTRREIATLVQQEAKIAPDGSFRPLGSPRLSERRHPPTR
jgi:hypothetical protein